MLERNTDLDRKTILVTGAAGFIGANLVTRLLKNTRDCHIIGLDNMNDYYDVSLKEFRLGQIHSLLPGVSGRFTFVKGDIADKASVAELFETSRPSVVVNLAAQAGVRYSIENPDAYMASNLMGFYNILEACRHSYDSGNSGVQHLVYASSSSVYGDNRKIPYSTDDMTDSPVSLYAATKKADELLAHAYSKLYGIPATGLRFFTVYGPAGRPDMAYFGFTNKLVNNETIRIYNYGNCKRDFTYIDDIVSGVEAVMQCAPGPGPGSTRHNVYNVGNSHPENLLDFVRILSEELKMAGVLPKDYNLEGHMKLVGMQPGDVETTYADVSAFERDFGFRPSTGLREGLREFAGWYRQFYHI